ncbi:MAG: cyclic nucleotide-binding domain-containing protein [Myxococcales bacterium]|nr:cyclic nucleotide-binding domain-containing protein [Myxococcales bacterium]
MSITIQQADDAFVDGKLEEALRAYTALLESDPANAYVWYRTALILGKMGSAGEALSGLSGASRALAKSGELLLSLCALKALGELDGGDALAQQRLREIAELYAASSSAVDRARRPPPGMGPREVDPGEAASADLRVLKELAADACIRAASAKRSDLASVPHHPLLSDLDVEGFEALIPLVEVRALPAGHVVIEEGSDGTAFYVVVRGVVEVRRGETSLAFLRSGAFFGEMALLTRSPRTATVRCDGPTILLELGREGVEELANHNPNVGRVLGDYTRQRLLGNLMATSPLFAPLDPARRRELMQMFETHLYADGDVVLAEGDVSPGLHVVLSGAVHVTKDDDGEQMTLADLEAGEVFGEISLIQQSPATATVHAVRKSVVLLLPRQAFNARVGEFPEVLTHVYKLSQARKEATAEAEEAESVPVDEDLLI